MLSSYVIKYTINIHNFSKLQIFVSLQDLHNFIKTQLIFIIDSSYMFSFVLKTLNYFLNLIEFVVILLAI